MADAKENIEKTNPAKIDLNFYDDSTLASLSLPEGEKFGIEVLRPDGTAVKGIASLPVNEEQKDGACAGGQSAEQKPERKKEGKSADGSDPQNSKKKKEKIERVYYIEVPSIPFSEFDAAADSGEAQAENLEFPCDVQRKGSPIILLNRFATSPVTIDCEQYEMRRILVGLPSGKEGDCASVPVAMTKLERSYTLGLLAYDKCIGDYIQHPDALIDGVKMEVTPVERTKAGSGPVAKARGGTQSLVTKRGYGEITGLTFRQLHHIQITPPPGYFCTSPPAPHLINCWGSRVQLTVAFQPCGEFPLRSVIFVQQACPGIRMPGLQLQAGGQPAIADPNGLWNIPQAITSGKIDFRSPGKVFSPPSIDLTKDAPMIITVAVAEQQTARPGSGSQRFQFVDEKGKAFAHRQLRLVSRHGYEEIVRTDEDGWFWAEEGYFASAEDDEFGYELSGCPLLTSNIE